MSARDRAARLRRQHSERSAAALQDSVKAAAQKIGTARLEAALTRDLGVAWVRRVDGRGREIAGISQDLLDAWSGPGSIPQQILLSIPDSVLAAAREAREHQLANSPSEPILYPVPEVRGLTESEARQMMADGLTSVQAERRAWTRYDLLCHIAWSIPGHAFTTAETLETLTTKAINGDAGIHVELVSQPRRPGPPDGRRYRIQRVPRELGASGPTGSITLRDSRSGTDVKPP